MDEYKAYNFGIAHNISETMILGGEEPIVFNRVSKAVMFNALDCYMQQLKYGRLTKIRLTSLPEREF